MKTFLLPVVAMLAMASCSSDGYYDTACSTDNDMQPVISRSGMSGYVESHEYVDLGLSVKWATCNVGANCAEECGDYFGWGEN